MMVPMSEHDQTQAALDARLVRNEQLKLAATAFNNVGVGFVVTGVIAPAAAVAYQVSNPHGRFWAIFVAICLLMGYLSHRIGRSILKGLRS